MRHTPNKAKKMSKKTILITGCSSGIGRHCIDYLANRGHNVIASARNPDDVTKLQAQGYQAIQLDLDDDQSIEQALTQTLKLSQGRIDALFNNGAYGQPGAVEDLSREALRAQFETNLFGTIALTNRVIPIMRQQQFGRIIQNSSVLGLVTLPFRGAYNASKFALEGISDTLRQELQGSGIDVCLIEPGPIESRFRANAFRMYQKYINSEHSYFVEHYRRTEKRLTKQGPAVPFTLPPEAVCAKVAHALESKKPKTRYYVTFPTYLFATLKWCLTDRALDRFLLKISSDEHR